MHPNKYKHTWNWFRNVCNFENFEKRNNFVWMVKPMAVCKVLSVDLVMDNGHKMNGETH